MSRARDLAVAGVLLCALAALFAIPALDIPGLAALLAAAVAPAWVALSASRARVTLSASVTTVHEGERVPLTVTLSRGLLRFPGGALVPCPGASAVALPSSRRAEIAASALAARRGRQSLGPARLRVADPLGICVRELASDAHEVLVLPQVYTIATQALGRLDERGRSPLDAALEIDSLRPYRPGSQASRIHWPAVARTGVLIERSFTAESESRVLVMLDARLPESEEALDQALRAAASLCVHFARRGGCLVLLPDDRRATPIGPDLRSWPALHARLALVQSGTGTGRGYRPQRSQTVLYVTAAAGAPALRGPCYRVGPQPLAGVDVAFSVAGFAGQLISTERARAA